MNMDGFDKLLRAAGAVVTLMGILIAWKGVTKMIPVTGIYHGGLFAGCGLFFAVVGIVLMVLPSRKAKKKNKLDMTSEEKE